MFIIKNKFIYLGISSVLVIVSLIIIFTKGLNISIDLTGGSVMEVSYDVRPDIATIQSSFSELKYTGTVQPFGEKNIIVKTRDLSEKERENLVGTLTVDGHTPKIERFNSVGPSVGKKLRSKAIIAMIIVMVMIILFVAYAFRHVARGRDGKRLGPSSSLYGVYAVVALLHDVVIPTGVFALLNIEVNSLFIVGLLSILGLSVNDTIVTFDRIRENLRTNSENKIAESFSNIVGRSITQTITRSISTSLTIMITPLILFLIGPESTKVLALVMLIGTFVGTYSSIFVASPLLVLSYKEVKE